MRDDVLAQTFCFVLLCCWRVSKCLQCYNCSTSNTEWTQCAGDFARTNIAFNDSKMFLANCTEENAMCFVRSWTARAQHSWLVQRGCYLPKADDPVPRSLNTPTRSMSCKLQRLEGAEYKVCLCQSNWCNSALRNVPFYKNFATLQYCFILISGTVLRLFLK